MKARGVQRSSGDRVYKIMRSHLGRLSSSGRPGLRSLVATASATIIYMLLGPLLIGCGSDDGSCSASLECGNTQVCLDGVCSTVQCRTNLNCTADSICDIEAGICVPLECRSDFDCSSDRTRPYCVEGRCSDTPAPSCTERFNCSVGQRCELEECVDVDPDGACGDNEDCPNPQVCDLPDTETEDEEPQGVCIDRCNSHEDCDSGDELQACVGSTGLCIAAECLDDVDCAEDEVCTSRFECAIEGFSCSTLTCDDPDFPFMLGPYDDMCRCVECLDSSHCLELNGEICSENNHCLICTVGATDASDCPEEQPILRDNCCVECITDDTCESYGLGSICLSGRCVPCNCLAGCSCPDNAECITEGDGVGVCRIPLGRVGDECFAQDECESYLACAYSNGQCVTEGVGGLCSGGCPAPSRCGATLSGAFCFGCHPGENECPPGTECNVRASWVDTFDGGECIPL